MSVDVTVTSNISVIESVSGPFVDSVGGSVLIDGINEYVKLNATSTPPATCHAPFQQALTAGAATIDLTSLTGSDGKTVNGTGLKVRSFKFRNPPTNANSITITFGATNGYLLLGTGWNFTLSPGQSTGPFLLADAAPVIDSTHKTIDLAGTGTQALDVEIVMG